jgi:hypothetical protein
MELYSNLHSFHQFCGVKTHEYVLHTQFNQDGSCLAISTNLGFKIYSLLNPNCITKLYEKSDLGIISLVEMQFRTNILAFVTRNSKTE